MHNLYIYKYFNHSTITMRQPPLLPLPTLTHLSMLTRRVPHTSSAPRYSPLVEMMRIMTIIIISFISASGSALLVHSISPPPAFAQSAVSTKPQPNPLKQQSQIQASPKPKTETSIRQRRKQSLRLCHQYNGKLVSYYDNTFIIKNCERVPIDHHTLNQHLKAGKTVIPITNKIINLIPLQKPSPQPQKAPLRCQDLEGNYVTTDHEDVYYIKGCKKKRFPDWHSYRAHRFKHDLHTAKFLFITDRDLIRLRSRHDFPSVLPADNDKIITAPPPSATEVCAELEAQFVAYYSRLYYIDNCKRRPVDTIQFSRLNAQLQVATTQVPVLKSPFEPNNQTDHLDQQHQPSHLPNDDYNDNNNDTHPNPQQDPPTGSPPLVIKITDHQWINLPLGKAYDLKNYTPPQPDSEPTTTN